MHAVGTPAPGRPLCDRCQHGIPKQALAGSKAERRRCQHAGCRQAPPQTWSKGQAMRGRPALARPLPQRPPGRLWRSGRPSSASRERCHAAQTQHAARSRLQPDQSDLTARAVKALNAGGAWRTRKPKRVGAMRSMPGYVHAYRNPAAYCSCTRVHDMSCQCRGHSATRTCAGREPHGRRRMLPRASLSHCQPHPRV